jgi:putative transposase
MDTEFKRRKSAVHMYYYQHCSKAKICRQLNCSRPWLDRWLKRYDPDNVGQSLSDHKAGPKPKQSTRYWSTQIRQQVIEMRQLRTQRDKWPYALIGAAAIHYELKALNCPEIPPPRTIHRWLVAEGLVKHNLAPSPPRDPKPIPFSQVNAVNAIQQLDLKGPVYLRGSNQKHYLAVLRDRYSRRCAIEVLRSRESQGITDFLVESWHWLGIPDYLQMDNALEFRGSNRYPRSFGRVVRVAIDLNIEPIFNPPHEPWRNGGVERQNGFLENHLLTIEHADLPALRKEAKACQTACNQTHRLAGLEGLTPHEVSAQAHLRLLSPTYTQHHASSLPQDKGFVSFVRLIRKSGRITLGAKDRFMVDPDLAYTYVLARVDLAQKTVAILQDNNILTTYDYSADTVGAWAEDDKEHKTESETNM